MSQFRQKTGIERLDALLGGGLLPGTLTVVMGASGIGKTQLGLAFAREGLAQEGETGMVFDMTSRGDSQNHAGYAMRLFDWRLRERSATMKSDAMSVWSKADARDDYMHVFEHSGRRVTAGELDSDQWRQWKAEQSRKLDQSIAFFYGNFIHGVRRCVIDGIEPVDRASDSIQLEMFEYIYHQILRKDHDWVARDLFRVGFRDNAERVALHPYDYRQIGCVLLYTSHEVMLDELLERKIQSGDVLSNANTIILMGKTREGNSIGRALHVAKHRGSECQDAIVPFQIDSGGLRLFDG